MATQSSGQEELLLEDPLLHQENAEQCTGDFSVDIHGRPAIKRKTGNWRACFFILGAECCERLAYFGIATNMINYLSNTLHQGNLSAARSVSIWQGTCYLTPILGAFVADAHWGRCRTIIVFSAIYFVGMCALSFSTSMPAFEHVECTNSICGSAPTQSIVFFFGLYLVALGTGGFKPCVSSIGADQFDDTDPKERVAKGSFFNWFYLSMQIGAFLAVSVLVWIQENIGWGLGFGIPAIFMGIAIISFLLGTPLYRFQKPGGSPLTRICQVVVASLHKWELEVPQDQSLWHETTDDPLAIEVSRRLEHSNGLRWLDKAAVLSEADIKGEHFPNPWRLCTITQVEELKILIRMFPIWATSIPFGIVYSQASTTFVQQGKAMERTIGTFTIPAASLGIFFVVSSIFLVLIYDKLIVPMARNFTGKDQGFSELQRTGIGLFMTTLSMVVAALVERQRLQLEEVQLKVFWQIPQYFLMGAASVLTYIGNLEFFYNQSPDGIRSLCSAFALLIVAVGSYFNSLILTVVNTLTTTTGNAGWIPDNLNNGHLDCFFWLLGCICSLNLLVYVFFAIKYKPKKVS